MDDIIEGTISNEEIVKASQAYEKSKEIGGETELTAKFQYAYALLRSAHSQDIKHGINLLENLYYEGEQSAKRDYLYYIAIGQTRLKNYNLALDCTDQFLQFEPKNYQALKLKTYIKERLTKEGLIGMAITGGAALAIGSLVALGLSLAKK